MAEPASSPHPLAPKRTDQPHPPAPCPEASGKGRHAKGIASLRESPAATATTEPFVGAASLTRPPRSFVGAVLLTRPPRSCVGAVSLARPPRWCVGAVSLTCPPRLCAGAVSLARPPRWCVGAVSLTRPSIRQSIPVRDWRCHNTAPTRQSGSYRAARTDQPHPPAPCPEASGKGRHAKSIAPLQGNPGMPRPQSHSSGRRR